MNSNSFFSWILEQKNDPFGPSQTEYAMALLGPSPDQTEIPLFDPAPFNFNLDDFLEQYPLQMGFPTSPGVYSPQSPLSTPPSPADEFSYMGAVDASTPYNSNSSPGRLSIPDPLADVHDAKQTKPNFEYDPATRKWVCTKCGGDFVTAHEARRHVKTAARCTGKKVECLRCGEHVHASRWSQKRHFATPLCRKKGRRRGAPTFTVDTAYKGVGEL